MYDACALPHTSRVSQALLRCFICCPSPKASCVRGLLHRRGHVCLGGLAAAVQTSGAQRSPSEDGSEEAGECGPQDTGQDLGDVSRSPSCSNEILETRRLPGEAIEGHTLQAESTVRAEGRSDVCSVVGLRCGWSVWVEGSQMCSEISRTGCGGPRGAAGSERSPKGRGCLGSLEGGCQGEAAAETQRGAHPPGSHAQSLITSHAHLPCDLAALLLDFYSA